jgi:hypothetical protein
MPASGALSAVPVMIAITMSVVMSIVIEVAASLPIPVVMVFNAAAASLPVAPRVLRSSCPPDTNNNKTTRLTHPLPVFDLWSPPFQSFRV